MPTKPDTENSIGAEPSAGSDPHSSDPRPRQPLLVAERLLVPPVRGGAIGRFIGRRPPAAAVDLTVHRGEAVGLVGESGSGKTALGLALTGFTRAAGGSLTFHGGCPAGRGAHRIRRLRRRVQRLFLAPEPIPATELVGAFVAQPLHGTGLTGYTSVDRTAVEHALERAGLGPGRRYAAAAAMDLTEDQLHRVRIARLLLTRPELILVGEPPADPGSPQRRALVHLLGRLRRELKAALLLLTSEPADARAICDTVAVIHAGRIVERGPVELVCGEPRHPYTLRLLADSRLWAPGCSLSSPPRSVPSGALPAAPAPAQTAPAADLATNPATVPPADPATDLPADPAVRLAVEPEPEGQSAPWGTGAPPDIRHLPLGCAYHPRCPVALDRCGWEARDLLTVLKRRWRHLDEQSAARERRLFADPSALARPGQSRVVLHPGRHGTAAELLGLLQQMRQEASSRLPREPFWRGVARLFEDSGRVVVEFIPPVEPVLGPPGASPSGNRGIQGVQGVQVACHLHAC